MFKKQPFAKSPSDKVFLSQSFFRNATQAKQQRYLTYSNPVAPLSPITHNKSLLDYSSTTTKNALGNRDTTTSRMRTDSANGSTKRLLSTSESVFMTDKQSSLSSAVEKENRLLATNPISCRNRSTNKLNYVVQMPNQNQETLTNYHGKGTLNRKTQSGKLLGIGRFVQKEVNDCGANANSKHTICHLDLKDTILNTTMRVNPGNNHANTRQSIMSPKQRMHHTPGRQSNKIKQTIAGIHNNNITSLSEVIVMLKKQITAYQKREEKNVYEIQLLRNKNNRLSEENRELLRQLEQKQKLLSNNQESGTHGSSCAEHEILIRILSTPILLNPNPILECVENLVNNQLQKIIELERYKTNLGFTQIDLRRSQIESLASKNNYSHQTYESANHRSTGGTNGTAEDISDPPLDQLEMQREIFMGSETEQEENTPNFPPTSPRSKCKEIPREPKELESQQQSRSQSEESGDMESDIIVEMIKESTQLDTFRKRGVSNDLKLLETMKADQLLQEIDSCLDSLSLRKRANLL